LTDPIFSQKVRDLLRYNELTSDNVNLLKLGRYFRLSDGLKLIIGRDEGENKKILDFAKPHDSIFQVVETPGPTALVRGEGVEDFIDEICRKVASYADDCDHGQIKITLRRKSPPFEELRYVYYKDAIG